MTTEELEAVHGRGWEEYVIPSLDLTSIQNPSPISTRSL